MDNKLTILKLSEKVKAYIKETEEETNREVYIKGIQDVGMIGMTARFMVNCNSKNIYVEIIELSYCDEKGNLKQEQGEIDRTIAHEITHGLLAYKEKYCQFKFFGDKKDLEDSISLLASSIEDIVVNIIIKKNSFKPISQNYLNEVVKPATEDMRKGKDIFERFNYSSILRKSFMMSIYIQAWGYLQYNFDLDNIDKKNLHKLLKVFHKRYPEESKIAEKITKTIKVNNIFTAKGYNEVIKKCLDLWDLTNLVEIYIC